MGQEKYLKERIKVEGKAGNLGETVKVNTEKSKIVVQVGLSCLSMCLLHCVVERGFLVGSHPMRGFVLCFCWVWCEAVVGSMGERAGTLTNMFLGAHLLEHCKAILLARCAWGVQYRGALCPLYAPAGPPSQLNPGPPSQWASAYTRAWCGCGGMGCRRRVHSPRGT